MSILDAAAEVAEFLEDEGIPYAIIGGLAVQHWGEPRTTRDVDVVVVVSAEGEERFLQAAAERFQPRMPDAITFARRSRVLLLIASDGSPIDLSLGIAGYEDEVVRRAVTIATPGHRPIRIVGPEDLVIHKCLAGRPRDAEDVERILIRRRLELDLPYIRGWLEAFAPLVDEHDVLAFFERALKKARSELSRK